MRRILYIVIILLFSCLLFLGNRYRMLERIGLRKSVLIIDKFHLTDNVDFKLFHVYNSKYVNSRNNKYYDTTLLFSNNVLHCRKEIVLSNYYGDNDIIISINGNYYSLKNGVFKTRSYFQVKYFLKIEQSEDTLIFKIRTLMDNKDYQKCVKVAVGNVPKVVLRKQISISD